jgi:hypothetical protein
VVGVNGDLLGVIGPLTRLGLPGLPCARRVEGDLNCDKRSEAIQRTGSPGAGNADNVGFPKSEDEGRDANEE